MAGSRYPSSPVALDTPQEKWAEAIAREKIIRPLAALHEIQCKNIQEAADDLGLSVSQVYRLLKAFRSKPVTSSLVVAQPGQRQGVRRLPPEIDTVIEEAIDTVFKRRERPTADRLFRAVKHECLARKLRLPSRKAIMARVRQRPTRELATAREGSKAARAKLCMVKPGLKPVRPLEIVQVDHTKVDIQLVDAASRMPLGRPWLTILLDMHTRLVVGFYIAFDHPSTMTVALAFAQAVTPKDQWLAGRALALKWPALGLPSTLHLDNAKEFHSRALGRGCEQHGVKLAYRPPATPHFGGHIERLMGTLMGRIHALPGTTFSSVAKRGDYPAEDRAVLSLDEFERILILEVLGPYHNEVHTALGQAPLAAWSAAMETTDDPPRLPEDLDGFVLDFLPFVERTIQRDGVYLFGITYFDNVLGTLLESNGPKRRIKFDPRDLSAVYLELPHGGYARLPYADLLRPPISLWEHQEVTRRLRAAGVKTVDQNAIFQAVIEQRQVLTSATSRSAATKRQQKRAASDRAGPVIERFSQPRPPAGDSDEEEVARVPEVDEATAWKTEFLP